jgi:putative tryptophan/tyrosine transport system substrate-binding protein
VRLHCPWLAITVAVLALLTPFAVRAQQPAGHVPRIGVLMFTPMTKAFQEGFRQGLREHGYVEGQSIVVEWRSAEGRTDRANALAAELVRLKVDVIVAEFTPAVQAAKSATQTIPIVMAPAGDPVATGLVASLARPGGNITGFSNIAAELSGKRLELLRELVPGLARVGLLIHGADPLDKAFVEETQAAAAKARIRLHIVSVARPEDLDAAFSAMTKERVGAVIVPGNLPVPAPQTARLAVRYRLPSISPLNSFAGSGGLMSYGANLTDIQRRAAGHVDRILKGARPADLPVERPTKFELVINRKTGKTLGITFPASMLLRVDQVIE